MPTIRVSEATYDAIHELGGTFDSADDIIRQLFEDAGQAQLLEQEDQRDEIDEEFENRVRERFDLNGDFVVSDDVIAVAQLIAEGADRTEAIQRQANERGVNPSTVRTACTRRIDVDGVEEFEQIVHSLD